MVNTLHSLHRFWVGQFWGVVFGSGCRKRGLEFKGASRHDSGEARGWGGPGSWYSHAQTTHSSRKPQAGTPSRAGTPLLLAPSQRGAGRRGRVPGRMGGSRLEGGVGVPACGVLGPVRGQEAWEYHDPGAPNEPGTPRIFPMTETAMTAETAKTVKTATVASFYCIS